MDNTELFVYDLLNPQNLDLCSHENNKKVCTKEHKIRILRLAKDYLIICQRIGILPLYEELQCQLKAMRDSKTEHDGGNYWTNCPIPPPRGNIFSCRRSRADLVVSIGVLVLVVVVLEPLPLLSE